MPGRRSVSRSSLPREGSDADQAAPQVTPSAAASDFVVGRALALHQLGEDLVKRRLVFLDADQGHARGPERLDQAGRGDARLRGRHDQAPIAGLLHGDDLRHIGHQLRIDRLLGIHLEHVAAEHAAAQLLRRIEGDQLPLGQQRDAVAVLRLGRRIGS